MKNCELEESYQQNEKAYAIAGMRTMLTNALVALNTFEATSNSDLAEISLERIHGCLKSANKRYPDLVAIFESMETKN